MNQQSKTELIQVFGLGLVVLLTGLLVNMPLLFLSVYLFIYIARILKQLGHVNDYVATGNEKTVLLMPIIDSLYSRIFSGQRRNKVVMGKLNMQLERNEKWLDQLRDGIVVIDEHDHIIRLNKRCWRLFDLKSNQTLGFSIYSLIRTPKFTEYLKRRNYELPLEIQLNNPKAQWLEITVTAFPYERLLLLRDITDRQQANQMKQDFIGNLSHELRTPLTVLRGYTETLPLITQWHNDKVVSDGDNQIDDDNMPQVFQSMLSQIYRLEQLVDDLTALVTIESAPVSSTSKVVNVPQLIQQQIVDCKMLSIYQQQKITAEIDETLGLTGNSKEILSIISNLICNAIKYSKPEQPIHVSWQKNTKHLIFSVEDKGVGIAEGHIPRLTERFYRVDNSRAANQDNTVRETMPTSGTGLGLAIVKHALINHQATLEVTSKLEIGSRFSCLFPLQRCAVI